MDIQNAGLRLWSVQKQQGTGLCVGLDPHLKPQGELEPEFYRQFMKWDYAELVFEAFAKMKQAMTGP